MTMQDTRVQEPPATGAAEPGVAEPAAPRRSPNVLADWLTTGDHRRIGRLYVAFALVFAVAMLVVAALLAFERVDDTSFDILHADAITQLFSFYFVGSIFLVAAPLLLGLA